VLSDGRVFVAGGEYSDIGEELNAAEIYDPVLDTWTSISTPPGWLSVGDAPCCVLADGRVLLGSIYTRQTALYDPTTNTWSAAGDKEDVSSEETWTLLPDGSVLTVECSGHPKTEKYLPATNSWVSAGVTPVDLVQASSIEIGPALLLPDGRVLAIGATGHTALYIPPGDPSEVGVWVAGPEFPKDTQGNLMDSKDAPGCLLPNGRVLCVAGPGGIEAEGGNYPGPTSFFECDGTTMAAVPDAPTNGGPPYMGRMLLLPTGQVLFSSGSSDVEIYTPDGAPNPAWQPRITGHPTYIRPGETYTLEGQQLNGLSQAVSYGDDATMATNYPLVRIQNDLSGHVWYCRTFGHSLGVATGNAIVTTNFEVPIGIDIGVARLSVVANGIVSDTVPIVVEPFDLKTAIVSLEKVNQLTGNLADGPLWVITPHGPVPVGPQDGDTWRVVQGAYQSIFYGLENLVQLGNAVLTQRLSAPIEQPRPIPRSNDDGDENRKAAQGKGQLGLPVRQGDDHSE
jgi:Kelch motif